VDLHRHLGLAALSILAFGAFACGDQPAATRSADAGAATTPSSSTTLGGEVGSTRPVAVTTSTPPPPRPTAVTTTAVVPTSARSGITGVVLFSPTCPVERIPPDPQCAPRPGPADVRLLQPDGSVAAQTRAGPDGTFTVTAAPGRYRVGATALAGGPGRGCQVDPEQVTVVAGSLARVAVSCDTGIR
jgi:hypothetical protein